MMVDKIKCVVKENQGIERVFRFHGSRNQIDEFQGVITELYPAVFIIKLADKRIKTFSYSDILTQNLEIL